MWPKKHYNNNKNIIKGPTKKEFTPASYSILHRIKKNPPLTRQEQVTKPTWITFRTNKPQAPAAWLKTHPLSDSSSRAFRAWWASHQNLRSVQLSDKPRLCGPTKIAPPTSNQTPQHGNTTLSPKLKQTAIETTLKPLARLKSAPTQIEQNSPRFLNAISMAATMFSKPNVV